MRPASSRSYAPSGTPIVDVLPAEWGVSKISKIARRGYRKFVDGDWIESPYITSDGVRLIQTGNVGVGVYKEQGFRFISEETFHLLDCTAVDPGDVLICRLADPVGRACLAPEIDVKMITSVDVCILKASIEWDTRYVTYFLSSKPYLDFMDSVSRGGTRDRVSRSFLGNVRIPKPSLREQEQIASFLDLETAEADALVAKYERLIKLLEEKRVALITQAVTKGLDPNISMKDSGTPWIGEMPKHWQALPLKFAVRSVPGAIKTGPFGTQLLSSDMTGGPFKVFNQMNVIERNMAAGDKYIGEGKFSELQSFEVFPKDVLLTTRGTIGRCCVVPADAERGVLHPCLLRIQVALKKMLPEYLAMLIQDTSFIGPQLSLLSNATTIDVIYSSTIKNLKILVPPIKEQQAILRFAAEANDKISRIRSSAMRAIELLRESRSALITAAVTGQIDITTYHSKNQPMEIPAS